MDNNSIKNSKLTDNEVQTKLPSLSSKRIGIAKKEMEGTDLSLETLNSIEVDEFDL